MDACDVCAIRLDSRIGAWLPIHGDQSVGVRRSTPRSALGSVSADGDRLDGRDDGSVLKHDGFAKTPEAQVQHSRARGG